MMPFSPPNQLTLLRILLTPLFVAFLFAADPILRYLSIPVFVLAILTDWYDGWVARRWGYVTRWGTFLDPLADKVVTSAALISFIYLDLAPAWAVWAIVARDLGITFLRSYSEYKGKPIETMKLAKTKTFLQFLLIGYVLLVYVASTSEALRAEHADLIDTLLDETLIYASVVVVAAITVWTGVLYILGNWKTIRELTTVSTKATSSS
jgi:CDP-diacylglycerol---glycerol-3-phosphate 3-phosphatidyltransferase